MSAGARNPPRKSEPTRNSNFPWCAQARLHATSEGRLGLVEFQTRTLKMWSTLKRTPSKTQALTLFPVGLQRCLNHVAGADQLVAVEARARAKFLWPAALASPTAEAKDCQAAECI